jgi:hypothetical protein
MCNVLSFLGITNRRLFLWCFMKQAENLIFKLKAGEENEEQECK